MAYRRIDTVMAEDAVPKGNPFWRGDAALMQ